MISYYEYLLYNKQIQLTELLELELSSITRFLVVGFVISSYTESMFFKTSLFN